MTIRLCLFFLWFLCLAASIYAGLRMLYCIVKNPAKAWVLAIAHDQLMNAAANGDPDKTISHRANLARREGRRWGCLLCKVLDWLDPNHCENANGV